MTGNSSFKGKPLRGSAEFRRWLPMKLPITLILLPVAVCLAIPAWGIAREWMWELEHSPQDGDRIQPSPGPYIAQVRALSEGDVVAPYGQGVFLRHRRRPHWSTSTLVFAGYCKPELKLVWLSARELAIECKIAEGTPKLLSAPKGILVTVGTGGS